MAKKLLITGGAGFIGSHCVLEGVQRGYDVYNLDTLTYAADLSHLKDVATKVNYHFIKGDIRDKAFLAGLFHQERFSAVMHLAAESHVDRSIKNPALFTETNVLGTQNMLEASRENGIERFVHVSTDEVYGELKTGDSPFTETTPLQPNSPYSASKAGSDLLVRAYHRTFGFPGIITRCSNNYGPHQDTSKLIPVIIRNATAGKKIPIYATGKNIRDWLYVGDHVQALFAALEGGKTGEVYNIGGNNERTNLAIARLLLKLMGKPESLIEFVADRPGHDFRYAIDSGKIQQALAWHPGQDFEKLLEKTIEWYTRSR